MKLKKCIFTLVVMLSGFSATVFAEGNVAKIGETEYATLPKAIEGATAGATITLVSDITASEIITIDKAITLDGNGKTLTSTAGRAINVDCEGNVTIKNLTINASGERAINVIQKPANVTIENVTATATHYTVNVAASAPEAVVTIKGSNLTGLNVVNVSAAGANVTVENSIVNCNDNNTTAGEDYAALCLNKDAVGASIVATNSTINVTDGSDSTKGRNGAEDGTVTINGSTEGVAVMVAVITYEGSDYYYSFETLEEAIEFAKADDVVTLIRDITASEIVTIDKAITLDGNDKTLTSTAGRAINIDCTDEVTIKNLTIVGSTGCERGINIINKPGTTNINNVTISGVSHYALHVATSATSATVNVTGSNLSGYAAIASYGSGAEVTVTNSELTGINDKADNGSNSFSTIALGSNTISVDEDSNITAKSEEGKALQFIVGATADVTGAKATISATLNVEGTAQYVGMDLSDEKNNSLTIKEEYKDEVWAEGYATVTQEEGMIAVKLIPTLTLDDDFNETLPTGTVTEVTYTRVLTAENTWYALYLPFQVPVTSGFLDNYDVAEFSQFNNNEGAMSITASLIVGETSLAANTPYLIRAKNEDAKNLSLFLENVIVYAGESQTYSEIEGISLTGVYEETAASDIPNAYALSGGVFKKAASDEQVLKPFRFYLEIEPAQAAALKTIAINVDGEEDGTTSIDNSIFTNNETVVYDLQGRRVENPAKGIYIVNGKKVVIK